MFITECDFATYMTPPSGQVYNAYSNGASIGANMLGLEGVALSDTDIPFLGNLNWWGMSSIIFNQGTGTVNATF